MALKFLSGLNGAGCEVRAYFLIILFGGVRIWFDLCWEGTLKFVFSGHLTKMAVGSQPNLVGSKR